ncbi:chromate transporter, partial [Duganella sp. Dugasp56]|uniref:chromate transporter n=1 Tax=Duganella sp. Dugasp56 TaxID=3243046 RepID=UPI0039AED067
MHAERHPLTAAEPRAAGQHQVSLATLALLFLRIGCTSIGGFMAMVSMTQHVIVERRRLLPAADLLDGLAMASVLPGPVAINVVAYTGYRLRGVAGACVAMLCAVLPAFACIVALGSLYFRFGSMDIVRPLFQGITPAIVAVILAAGCRLWRGAVHDGRQAALGIAAALALTIVPGLPTTLAVMALAAATGYIWRPAAVAPAPSVAVRPADGGASSARGIGAALAGLLPPRAWLSWPGAPKGPGVKRGPRVARRGRGAFGGGGGRWRSRRRAAAWRPAPSPAARSGACRRPCAG